MNTKCKVLLWPGIMVLQWVMATSAFGAAAAAGTPEWEYPDAPSPGGVSSWSQIIDPTSTAPVPLNYPYSECGIGHHQSPINVNSQDFVQRSGADIINFYYNSADPLSLLNNGHNILVEPPTTNPDKLYFGTVQSYVEFTLAQYHIHVPSEHTLNGASFPMEIHFVHATPDGREAVVAVIVQAGAANPELQKILDNAPTSTNGTSNPANVTINLNGLLPAQRSTYLTYAGSLTTPPCTEGVDWYILTNTIQASAAQIAQFGSILQADIYGGLSVNARNTNNLNGRLINLKP